jgi:hypothetical protein
MKLHEILVSHRAMHNALVQPQTLESAAPNLDPAVHAVRVALQKIAGGKLQAAMLSQLSDAVTALEDAQRDPGIITAVENPMASALQSFLAEKAEQTGRATAALTGGFEAKFDDHDILGWLGSFFTWWRGLHKHDWLAPPAMPDTVDNSFRMAVMGDWGTGLYGAPICSDSIDKDSRRFDLLLHLGDVYYSGTEKEVADRFLQFWPKRSDAMSRALNSNHEMYTGGHAYFNQSLRKFGQNSSCFACQNASWLLVGLDSAYHDHDLANQQAEWLEGLAAAAGNRKIVLFSHHQPYSLIEKQGTKLVEKLGNLLGSGRIFAWYWGHEHRCVIYDIHAIWRLYGRCIGHGGYPYYRTKPTGAELAEEGPAVAWYRLPSKNLVPGGLLLDGPNPYVPGEEQRYGPNGYAVLEFEGEHLTEAIHTPDGAGIFRRQLA